MFWRRRTSAPSESAFPVNEKVSRLGIERRRHVRVRYPCQNLTTLPQVYFNQHPLTVFDLSVGGLCLLDAHDKLGPNAGNTIELKLVWPDCERLVKCRLVSRVHDRRHIEFLDLEGDRVAALKAAMILGVAGLGMKPIFQVPPDAVQLEASEAWTSIAGDALTLFYDVHLEAELTINNRTYRIYKNSGPVTDKDQPATTKEFEGVLLFLGNIPQPSSRVSNLKTRLEAVYREVHR